MPRLAFWKFTQYRDTGTIGVEGIVTGHPRGGDGEPCKTSPIKSYEDSGAYPDDMCVITKSGTRYYLDDPITGPSERPRMIKTLKDLIKITNTSEPPTPEAPNV